MEDYASRQEQAAAREADAFHAGSTGSGHFAGSFQEMQAYERGQALAGGRGRGRGGGALSPIVLPFFAVMAIGFWPLCGVLTLSAGFGSIALLGLVAPGLSDGWAALVGLGAGIAGLTLGWRTEQRLAASRSYRVLRHVVRLGWLGVLFVYLALLMSFGGAYDIWPDDITLEWIDSKLSPGMYIMIFAGVVLTHFVSRAFDDRIEGRVDPERAEKRKVDRGVRWRRMKIAFWGAGAVGAAGAALYGDAAGAIFGAFLAFGVVATVLYWGSSHMVGMFRH